ncbi:transcription factor grauzone-like [Armigeres subalbatus]|uniref:transcription factor grauzone-like n=1 Tax=Armigeres subalbatus TaxID=124917 RepID=UPI002ED37B33
MENSSPLGCRLCLDPFADNFDSIDNLKEQMEKVFQFAIVSKQGFSTIVCQSCSYKVCEFYKYSEKVRVNQELLATDTKHASELPSNDIKAEPTIPINVVEDIHCEINSTGDKQLDLKEESEAELVDDGQCQSDDSYKPPVQTSNAKRKGRRRRQPQSSEDSDSFDSEDDVKLRPKRKLTSNPKSREQREKDEKLINEFYRMMCDVCSFVSEDYESLRQHFRDDHGRKSFVTCCKKKLTSRKMLLDHIAYHKNPNVFQCDQCNKSYKNVDYLKVHKENIHSSEDKEQSFGCDECDKSFSKKYQLKQHQEKHKKIQCQICNRFLSTSLTLNAHMANMHSEKNRIMVCDFCGQEFLNKFCFDRHLDKHKGIEVPKLQCQICQKWYRGERNLQGHIENSHNQKGRQFQCDICHKYYPNDRTMKKHKRDVHVEERFECEFCGKRFKQSFNLKEHRTTHTGEVLYSCDYCGVTKNSRANLYVHVKQKHPMEWAERKRQQAEANATM